MKYLLFAPLALLLLAFTTVENQKSPESMPEYQVKLIKADPNLPKGSGQVTFTFYSGYGKIASDSVRMSYNGKEEKLGTTADGKSYLALKSGKYKFQFYYNAEHFEIYTDSVSIKDGWQTGIEVWFMSSVHPVMAEKPVIYVYPDATQQVSIQLGVNGNLGFTYPQYNKTSGWNFTADPDGSIHMNGKEYDYLFWDAETNINITKVDQNSGFVVHRDSLPSFFETQLTAMGLTPRERGDFITYWTPQMQQNEQSFIHFMFTEAYNNVATINITPKPDHLFRVFMLWDDASRLDYSRVRAQKIETVQREGFTVVEWGGARVQFLSTKQKLN